MSHDHNKAPSSNDRECPICLTKEIQHPTRLDGKGGGIECTHIFCQSCIMQWAEHQRVCPLCRLEFQRVDSLLTSLKPPSGDNPNPTLSDRVHDLACRVCESTSSEETMVLCDGCNKGWHIACMTPQLEKVPDGDWYCAVCANDCKIKELQKEIRKLKAKNYIEKNKTRMSTYASSSSCSSSESWKASLSPIVLPDSDSDCDNSEFKHKRGSKRLRGYNNDDGFVVPDGVVCNNNNDDEEEYEYEEDGDYEEEQYPFISKTKRNTRRRRKRVPLTMNTRSSSSSSTSTRSSKRRKIEVVNLS